MRLLHTSDWHVGKTMRGRDRHPEYAAVLAEIVGIADARDVDVVVVAGDLFESAAPSPEAEQLVYRTLLDLVETGASVVVIAGNHDNPRRLDAVAPVFDATDHVHIATGVRRPDEGGVLRLEVDSGETLNLALVPFVSKRGIVRTRELWETKGYELGQTYQKAVTAIMQTLCARFDPEMINVLVAHAFVSGAVTGDGERTAHILDDYLLPINALPATANYVALGHLHRPQKVISASPTYYCGSPLQMDFGETRQTKQVNIVELTPGVPGKVTGVPLSAGWPLVTLEGTVADLAAMSGDLSDEAWYRVRVTEARRAGLADEVRAVLGPAGNNAVEITIRSESTPNRRTDERRIGASPHELFEFFLADRGVDDPRVLTAFDELLAEESEAGAGAGDASEAEG